MIKQLIAASLLATAIPTAAQAQDASVRVTYADLDLTSDGGVQSLDHRIAAAIKQVCGDRMGQKPLSTVLAIRRCDRLTRADIDAPRQVAIDRAQGRQPSVEMAAAGSFAIVARRR